MKIFLKNQNKLFHLHLQKISTYKIITYSKKSLTHKIYTQQINTISDINSVNLKDFFNYKIFPTNILQSYTQWEHEGRDIQVNDTIVQQILIPPILGLSQKIITGVRIKEIFNNSTYKGFSYETLEGHVEKGVSIFIIEQKQNYLDFTIETYSSANGIILSLFQSLSSLYQDYCTKQALKYVSSYLSTPKLV